MKRVNVVSIQMIKEKSISVDYVGQVNSPKLAYEVINKLISNRDREHLVVVCLDTKNKVTCAEVASVGSLNSSVVHPREIFKIAILSNSASIIIGHNHPSGDTTPSQEDRNITKRLSEAGKILGIELLDHIITNHEGKYISFKEMGIL